MFLFNFNSLSIIINIILCITGYNNSSSLGRRVSEYTSTRSSFDEIKKFYHGTLPVIFLNDSLARCILTLTAPSESPISAAISSWLLPSRKNL